MSRYSVRNRETGEREDIVISRTGGQMERVLVGERRIGSVGQGRSTSRHNPSWTAIAYGKSSDLYGQRSVQGFRTQWDAVEYLLQVTTPPETDPDHPDMIGWTQLKVGDIVNGREMCGSRPSQVVMLLGPEPKGQS